MTAKLIIFEGPDLVGKSTVAASVQRYIQQQYSDAAVDNSSVLLRDPGSTEVGDELRSILLDPAKNVNQDTLLFGFLAARSELLSLVRTHLVDNEDTVILDRLWPSTLAYQVYGSGGPYDITLSTAKYLLEKYVPLNVRIHYVFLSASREVRRARQSAEAGRGCDRFESKPDEFFNMLDIGYEKALELVGITRHCVTSHSVDVTRLSVEQAAAAVIAGLPAAWVAGNRIIP